MTASLSKSLALAALAASALSAGAAYADDGFSFNAGAVTEYRYRGVSQSNLKPAAQGGIDYAHSSGFYVGTWASTIKWLEKANYELDIYGGYKGEIRPGLAYDVGVLRYQYVDSAFANTNEVYGALTYGVVTAKYSHSTTNLFGAADSKGSGYLDLSASFDLGNGMTLVPHLGRQIVKNSGASSYTDYAITLNKDLGQGLSASLSYIDLNKVLKASATQPDKDMGAARLVAGIKYSF